MKIIQLRFWILFGLIIWMTPIILGQETVDTAKKQSPIIVIQADHTSGVDKGRQSTMTGNVILRQDSVVMYAEKVKLDVETNHAQAFVNVTIQRTDSTNAFCEELDYDGNSEYATMMEDVVLENGSQQLRTDRLEYDLFNNIAYYEDRALMLDGQRVLSSKRGRYYIDSSLVVFHDSVVIVGPDYILATDSLHFNTRTKRAHFVSPVRMKQKENEIYCEAGYFDLNENYAELRQNAQFRTPDKSAKADTIYFNGNTEDVNLLGHAYVKENTEKGIKEVNANRIDYLKSKDRVHLSGDFKYKNENQHAQGDYMEYVISTGKFNSKGRTTIHQGSQKLESDNLEEIENSDFVIATGNVIWKDTVENITLLSEKAELNKEEGWVKAYGKDLQLISQLEGDSLYLTADTLFTWKKDLPDSSSVRHLHAYHNVVGFKNNLQFVADSISFTEEDSLFRFFGEPVIWSDTSRFYGDTIRIQLANEQLEKIYLIDHAFVINKNNTDLFNQIKGREIIAQFADEELQRTRVKGNAESIYYATDKLGAYIGVNKVACSEMDMTFINNEISRIAFYRKPTNSFYPMLDVDHVEIRFDGFSNDESRRAQFPSDIFRIHTLLKLQ